MVTALEGKAGFLFLSNDTNAVLDQHTGKNALDAKSCSRILTQHLVRSASAEQVVGSKYVHILVPNKETAAKDFLPSNFAYEKFGPSPANSYLSHSEHARRCTFFAPEFLRVNEHNRLYYRTDSHWTYEGALRYTAVALQHFGYADLAGALSGLAINRQDSEWKGDLGEKINAPPEVMPSLTVAEPASSMVFCNEIPNEGCVRHFKRSHPCEHKKLLFLHDSTANWLIRFVPELFEETLMIHTPDLDMAFLRAYSPDIVMFMQVERFLPRIPRNDVDYFLEIQQQEERKGGKISAASYFLNQGWI